MYAPFEFTTRKQIQLPLHSRLSRIMSLSKPQRIHKPRFKDWLVDVLDRNLTDDARWIDRTTGLAVIRWPHKSRGTWSLEKDAKLFAMWAVRSGKFRPGCDKPNPKSWKCNFRMNLNICKTIEEIRSKRIAKGPDSCRFFRFLDRAQPVANCIYQSCAATQPASDWTSSINCGFRGINPTQPNISDALYSEIDTIQFDPLCPAPQASLANFEQPGPSLNIDNYNLTELSGMADSLDRLNSFDPYMSHM